MGDGTVLTQAAREHLDVTREHYDLLLGTGGQPGTLEAVMDKLLVIAGQYPDDKKQEAFAFGAMYDAIKGYRSGLSEARDLLEKAAAGEELDRFKEKARLGMLRGLSFANTLDDFVAEKKGVFTRGELQFQTGARPSEMADTLAPIRAAAEAIARDRQVEGGVDYAGLGIRPPEGVTLKPRPSKLDETARMDVAALAALPWSFGNYNTGAGDMMSMALAGTPEALKPVEAQLTAQGISFSNRTGGRVMVMDSSAQGVIAEVLQQRLAALEWDFSSYNGSRGKALSMRLTGDAATLKPVEDMLKAAGVGFSNRSGNAVVVMDGNAQDFIHAMAAARKVDTAALLIR